MKLTIGTRGSALALWQSRLVAAAIRELHPEISVELMTIKTKGDKILDTPLANIGGKGLFTKEIEEALLDERIDLAVHSMKDVPTELLQGLKLAGIMKRADPRDVFVSRDGKQLQDLDSGARIGTSSLRRKAFLLNRFPQLMVVPVRGNVETRLKKIETENLSGVMLAAAGMIRMGFSSRITSFIDPEFIIPAIGQGAIAIEVRDNDRKAETIIAGLNHPETAQCVGVERAFLHRMGGGCQVPMAAHCVRDNDNFNVVAGVAHPDGIPVVRHAYRGPRSDTNIGIMMADFLIERGAADILKSVLGKDWAPGSATYPDSCRGQTQEPQKVLDGR